MGNVEQPPLLALDGLHASGQAQPAERLIDVRRFQQPLQSERLDECEDPGRILQLDRAGQRRNRETGKLDAFAAPGPACIVFRRPGVIAPRAQELCPEPFRMRRDRSRHIRVREDGRPAGTQDACFLETDFLDVVSQPFAMVE